MPKVKSSTLRVRKHRAITTIPLYPHEVNENAGADDEDDEGNLEINREDPGVVNEFQNLDVEFDSGESSGSSAGCEEGSGLFHSEDRSGSSHFEERSGSSHSEEGSVSSHFEEGGESSQSEEESELSNSDELGSSSDSEGEFVNEIVEAIEDEPEEVKKLRILAVTKGIEQETVNGLLKILRRRLFPELPKSAKTFLGTSSAEYEIKEMQDSDGSVGEYVYFGIEEGLKKCIDPNVHTKSTIFLQFNADGISLTKSGEQGFWVLSGKVHYKPDIYKPFAVLIYCGNSKPASLDDYLRDFIEEVNNLQANGVTILNRRFNVRIHCFICDTPARAFVKGTKGHTGFYACERCEIRGLKEERVTQFPLINCPERTDESFRTRSQRRHHNRASPILQIRPFVNMILMFVLDFMHLFCEGIMKRLLQSWFVLPGFAKVGQRMKMEVSRRLLLIRKSMPCEFPRKMRSLKSIKKWKATQFKFILLYCGPIVLLNILDSSRFKNFLLLHVASRILCNDRLIKKYQQHAKIYLQRFFVGLRGLYSRIQVLNMHCAIHVADDVLAMGCNFNRICAFTFENFLGKLTSLIRTANRPLAQICRRLHELNQIDPPKPHIPYKIQILKCDGLNILKVKYKECTFKTTSPDNLVMLKNKSLFQINRMTRMPQGIEIQGNLWRIRRSLFVYPTDSKDLYMWELRNQPCEEILSYDLNYVKRKMVKLEMNFQEGDPLRVFCMPLLHHE